MPSWSIWVPGIALLVAGFVVSFLGIFLRSGSRVLTGVRLRWLGIAVLLASVGVKLLVDGLQDGPRWGSVVVGLLAIGLGGLWVIGSDGLKGGILPSKSAGVDARDREAEANRGSNPDL